MMTRRSSLQFNAPTTLLDSISRPIPLGPEIGRGGEGSVFEVFNDRSLVAKVYRNGPLPEEQAAKLQAMVSCWSEALESIAAWPRSILFDPNIRKPCGILLTRIDGARPLHELYGTTNRRRHFPGVGWQHLVLAARNTAAAFQTLHAANILVGDVNQGNLLIDQRMCLRMIDCDSFQLTSNGRTFLCPVGTPHFTPPELQPLKLQDTIRTQNHDRFGLAILIFHLLFVGRHPFAGRYRGSDDLSIEKAIAERRFAFSRHRAATLVDPPPASLLLEDLPDSIGELFEAAFRSDGNANARPTPIKWVQELEGLMKARRVCRFDPIHFYSAHLRDCPWCRIEDEGGPAFFVSASGTSELMANRLAIYDERIFSLKEIRLANIPPNRLLVPNIPQVRTSRTTNKRTWADWNSALLIASWFVCFASLYVSGKGGPIALAVGAALSVALGITLVAGKGSRERRKTCDDYVRLLQKSRRSLANLAVTIHHQQRQRESAFAQSLDIIRNETTMYRTAEISLQDAIANQRLTQKADFLRGFAIRDSIDTIPKLTFSQVAMLESFSVETAYDVEQLRLYGIPSIDPNTVMELLNWRREVEAGFQFVPQPGVSHADATVAKESAVQHFKISQARKILTATRQMEAQAEDAAAELARMCVQFDDATERWKVTAKQYRESQSRRRFEERMINKAPATILGYAAGLPAIIALLYLFFGR